MVALPDRQHRTFGSILRAIRMEMGFSYHEVANQGGCSTRDVRAWERDERRPTHVQFKRLVGMMRRLEPYAHLARDIADERVIPSPTPDVLAERYAAETVAVDTATAAAVEAAEVIPQAFGEALRYMRMRDGLSPHDVADMLGVTDGAVKQWEYGDTTPVFQNLERLLQIWPNLPPVAARDIPKPVGRGTPAPLTLAPPPVVASPAPEPAPSIADLGIAYARALADAAACAAELADLERALGACRDRREKLDALVKMHHARLLEATTGRA